MGPWLIAVALAMGLSVAPADAQTKAAGTTPPPDPDTWSMWASPDGSYRLDLFGALQALYQLDSPDGEANPKPLGPDLAAAASEASSSFRIRRARLGAKGHVWSPALEYHVQLELAGSSASLKRVYLNWRALGTALQVEAGKFKVPFGRQQLTSYTRQQLVDRSIASDEFAKGEDDGVMVWGRPFGGTLEWYAGVFNGEENHQDDQQDARNLWAGRLVWSPFGPVPYAGSALSPSSSPRLALGAAGLLNGGWLFDVDGTGGLQAPQEVCTGGVCTLDHGDDATVRQGSLELAAMWGPASAGAEYFRRWVDPRASELSDLEAAGWYVQGGVVVIPERVEIGARLGRLDRDLSTEVGEVGEVSPFVNWFVHGDDLKLQADFAWLSTKLDSGESLLDRRARVSLLVTF